MKGLEKPFATLSKSRAVTPQEQRDNAEEAELLTRRQELENRNQRNQNRVAALLSKASFWVTNWTHPCLFIDGYQTSITEYYPDIKLALDKFYDMRDFSQKLCDRKKERLAKFDIQYVYLTPEKKLSDLSSELKL